MKLFKELGILEQKIIDTEDLIKNAEVKDLDKVKEAIKELDLLKLKKIQLDKDIEAFQQTQNKGNDVKDEKNVGSKDIDKNIKEKIVKDAEVKDLGNEEESHFISKNGKTKFKITPTIKSWTDKVKAAITTGNMGGGETTIPKTVSQAIVEIAKDESDLVSLVTEVSAASWIEPVEKDGFRFTKTAEGAEYDEKNVSVTTFTLSNHQYGAVANLTHNVVTFSTAAFLNHIIYKFGEALADTIEEEIWKGNGTNGLLGIAATTGINSISLATRSTLTATELEGWAEDTLKDSDDKNAVLVMHRTTWSKIKNLKDGDGRYLFSDKAVISGRDGKSFKEYPVITSSFVAKLSDSGAAVIAVKANMKEFILNRAADLQFDSTIHEKFSKGLTTFRGIIHMDGKIRRKEAFSLLKNKA